MKFALSKGILALLAAAAGLSVNGECTSSKEYPINDATKLSFSGFLPSVKRTLNTGVGNKIVLRNYKYDPVIEEGTDGTLQVSLGDPCDGDSPGTLNPDPDSPDLSSSASRTAKYFGLGLASTLLGGSSKFSSTLAFGLGVSFLSTRASAEDTTISECDLAPIEVEIYVDSMADELVQKEYQAGAFGTCPPESLYWKHHKDVFMGYEGCVAEFGLYPCQSDAFAVLEEEGEFYAQSPVYWDGQECVETSYTMENRTLWIVWGHPMDKYELAKRTGISPVISFPYIRGPYPLFEVGGDAATTQDESNDARIKAKELLEYIGAWSVEELADWTVTITEGAEQGMVHLYAAKAMEIAMTTCNRDIYIFVQAPAYGYSTDDAAAIANQFSGEFYNSSECACYTDDSCKDPLVTITVNGWLPNTPMPEAMGADGNMYAANSDSPDSPWFETLVFPENPSGVIKVPQLPDSNRRVCDGVYLWPMYFGARDFVIPKDELPDCSAWAFSISKIYSAAARAGWIMYKKDPETNHNATVRAIGTSYSLTHGSVSEWTWFGQLQLFDIFMSKELSDPTSWIGAYSSLMKDKWDAILEGFADCPITQPSNPYSGAYVWFVFQEPYLGLQQTSVPSFFRDVLGVMATTYSWGFRGADPASYYGEGYTGNDFTRLQMYRDLSVYQEVGRRAKIVCNDLDAVIGGNLVSVNQWVTAATATGERRLTQGGYASYEDRIRHLAEELPELTAEQLMHLADTQVEGERHDAALELCAPEYTTQCLFDKIGIHDNDIF